MSRRGYAEDPSELSTPAVLKREIPWDTYLTARLISDRDLQLIKRYDKAAKEQQARLLKEVRAALLARDRWDFRVDGMAYHLAETARTPQEELCIFKNARLKARQDAETLPTSFLRHARSVAEQKCR